MKKFRKLLALGLAAVMTMSVAVGASAESATETAAENPVAGKKVAYVMLLPSATIFQMWKDSCQNLCDALDVDFDFFFCDGDFNKWQDTIRTCASAGYDGLLVSHGNQDGSYVFLKEIHDEYPDMKIVTFDTQFYTDKAQKAKGYGDDVLWVGNTFGLGALRGWNGKEPQPLTDVKYRTQRIISSGPVRSIVEVGDNQWRVDPQKDPVTMVIRYVLYAGHRDVHVTASFSRKVPDLKFSTGIINVKGSKEYSDHAGLRGCWGTDWPAGLGDTINWKRETVGLGICIPRREIVSEQPANQDNYAFVVNTPQDVLQYDIAFCSDNEDFGYHRAEDWFHFLETWKEELSNPVTVSRVR